MCVNYRLAKQATKVLETEKGSEIVKETERESEFKKKAKNKL